jgi:exopolyphosphatase/guanosine-5'-triphosphate,3'-diphosphate pyrophosphatase
LSILAQTDAPDRRQTAGTERVAVVDIGSNSIRLEIFDGLTRAFCPLFNEKVICGLGRGLKASGRLSEEGVEMALANLPRFTRMAHAMGAAKIDLLATAAVREAENGAWFIAEVERRCGHPVRVLSGEEEARISALGVLAGMPDADGVMGDLGGGSLELVELGGGALGDSATLSLGTLRLLDLGKEGRGHVRAEIDRNLERIGWLERLRDRSFYAVGGAWRNLARIHMGQVGYRLPVIQGYTLSRRDTEEFARLLAKLGARSLMGISGTARRRQEVLPYAALLLRRILRLCRPARVVLSAYGLREGFMFEQLPAEERAKDPLLAAAADLGIREGRFGDLGALLAAWTGPLFPEQDPESRRLHLAVCHLSDLAWREHSDYRGAQALYRVLHYPFSGLDHRGRAFLGYAVFNRYGRSDAATAATARALLTPGEAESARVLGLALRLAYRLSGGSRAVLQSTKLAFQPGELRLVLPGDGSIPLGETVERRFQALAKASGAERGRIVG